MKADQQSIGEARNLMLRKDHAILATHSLEYPGYPFGSVVPYVCDKDGLPLVLISNIAQHTKNMLADDKVSMTILALDGGDVQAEGRLCLMGKMIELKEGTEEAARRYFSYFEQAKVYHEAHDFQFYTFLPESVRYIGGFGKIFWISAEDFFLANPFYGNAEAGILEHMNAHHVESIRAYCSHYGKWEDKGLSSPVMLGIDAEGIDILADKKRIRIGFEAPISTATEARQVLMDMSEKAKV